MYQKLRRPEIHESMTISMVCEADFPTSFGYFDPHSLKWLPKHEGVPFPACCDFGVLITPQNVVLFRLYCNGRI